MELQISLKKIATLCLMDSKDLYIYGSVMTYTILKKIAAILNLHVNIPPSWIMYVSHRGTGNQGITYA